MTKAQQSYYPLKKGQITVFKYSDTFNNGDKELTLKVEVLDKTEIINDNDYVMVQTSYGKSGSYTIVSTVYVRVKDDGSVMSIENKSDPNEQTFLSTPLELGKKWEQMARGVSSTIEILDLEGSIETPDKTYSNCLVLQNEISSATTRTYLKEGIGMVAIVLVKEDKEQLMTYLAK